MYIQNMTTEEMVREYRADLLEIEPINDRIDQSECIAKKLRKAKKANEIYYICTTTTKRNNKYINIFQYIKSDTSTRKTPKWNFSVRNIALMQTYKGVAAISFFDNPEIAIVFQQHFFTRYKERLLKVCDWKTRNELMQAKTIEQIIAVWAKRNPEMVWINTKVKFDDKEHIFVPINDGAMLLQWDGNYIQANTFITDGMYSSKQIEMIGQAEEEQQNEEKHKQLINTLKDLMSQENNINL